MDNTITISIYGTYILRLLSQLYNIFFAKKRIEPISSCSNFERTNSEKLRDMREQMRLFFHSVRGPVNNTLLGISLLEDTINNTPETRELLNNVKTSCTFAANTLNQYVGIKTIMRPNSIIPIELTKYPLSLHGFFQQIDFLIRFQCIEKKIKYAWTMPPDICNWVVGDEHNLIHVVVNILEKSISTACEGSCIIMGILSEKTHVDEQIVTITITDNSTPRKDIASDPIWQTSMNIIKMHGGKLNHTWSGSDSGSVAMLSPNRKMSSLQQIRRRLSSSSLIPYHREPTELPSNRYVIQVPFKICTQDYNSTILGTESALMADKNNELPLSRISSFRRAEIIREISQKGLQKDNTDYTHNICVIDDSELARKMLIRVLNASSIAQEIKIVVHQAENGLDAVLQFYSDISNISVIFLDNMMPTLAGPITAKLLRALGYKNLIIGVTGNSMEDDVKQFQEAGIDYLFTKPFTREHIDAVWKLIKDAGFKSKLKHKLAYENGVLSWSREPTVPSRR